MDGRMRGRNKENDYFSRKGSSRDNFRRDLSVENAFSQILNGRPNALCAVVRELISFQFGIELAFLFHCYLYVILNVHYASGMALILRQQRSLELRRS